MTYSTKKENDIQLAIGILLLGRLCMSNLTVDRKEPLNDDVYELAKDATASLQSRLCMLLGMKPEILKEAMSRLDRDIDDFTERYKVAN